MNQRFPRLNCDQCGRLATWDVVRGTKNFGRYYAAVGDCSFILTFLIANSARAATTRAMQNFIFSDFWTICQNSILEQLAQLEQVLRHRRNKKLKAVHTPDARVGVLQPSVRDLKEPCVRRTAELKVDATFMRTETLYRHRHRPTLVRLLELLTLLKLRSQARKRNRGPSSKLYYRSE